MEKPYIPPYIPHSHAALGMYPYVKLKPKPEPDAAPGK